MTDLSHINPNNFKLVLWKISNLDQKLFKPIIIIIPMNLITS